MTDLTIQTTPAAGSEDYSWLAGDDGAFETAQSGTLRIASLTSGTHYDATTKSVPAGVAVAKITSGTGLGQYAPFDSAATNGQQVLAGFTARPIALLRDSGVLSTTVLFARVVSAVIRPSALPVAAHRTIDRTTATSGKFAFVA
jgi:hypothetical protein